MVLVEVAPNLASALASAIRLLWYSSFPTTSIASFHHRHQSICGAALIVVLRRQRLAQLCRQALAEVVEQRHFLVFLGQLEALKQARAKPGEVKAIGVRGQQHGFVPLDKNGDVIRPAKLWCDTTTTAECEAITKKLDGLKKTIGYFKDSL